jgi:hypothetical protein
VSPEPAKVHAHYAKSQSNDQESKKQSVQRNTNVPYGFDFDRAEAPSFANNNNFCDDDRGGSRLHSARFSLLNPRSLSSGSAGFGLHICNPLLPVSAGVPFSNTQQIQAPTARLKS